MFVIIAGKSTFELHNIKVIERLLFGTLPPFAFGADVTLLVDGCEDHGSKVGGNSRKHTETVRLKFIRVYHTISNVTGHKSQVLMVRRGGVKAVG